MTTKYDFFENYLGPHGPHLNHLSLYTKTRKDEDRLRGDGIHARNRSNAPQSAGLVNTRKVSGDGHRRAAIAGLEAHLLRHPKDAVSAAHLAMLRA